MELPQRHDLARHDDIHAAGNDRLHVGLLQKNQRSGRQRIAHRTTVIVERAVGIVAHRQHDVPVGTQQLHAADRLFDIGIEKGDLRAAVLASRNEHLAPAGQQPQQVDLWKMLDDPFAEFPGDAVVPPFDLVKIFTAGESDITGKIIRRHVGPFDDTLDSLPIILIFVHYFKFFLHLCIIIWSRSSMDRI